MRRHCSRTAPPAVALKPLVANANHCEIIVAPVFTALKSVADRLEGSNIKVAAQNCATERNEGAFTGEVAPFMLRDAGCSRVIVGHSERRQYFLETDQIERAPHPILEYRSLAEIGGPGRHFDFPDQGYIESGE